MSADQFVKLARSEVRPPMLWFNLRAMTDRDVKAIYAYLKHLGPAGQLAPQMRPGRQDASRTFCAVPRAAQVSRGGSLPLCCPSAASGAARGTERRQAGDHSVGLCEGGVSDDRRIRLNVCGAEGASLQVLIWVEVARRTSGNGSLAILRAPTSSSGGSCDASIEPWSLGF